MKRTHLLLKVRAPLVLFHFLVIIAKETISTILKSGGFLQFSEISHVTSSQVLSLPDLWLQHNIRALVEVLGNIIFEHRSDDFSLHWL